MLTEPAGAAGGGQGRNDPWELPPRSIPAPEEHGHGQVGAAALLELCSSC